MTKERLKNLYHYLLLSKRRLFDKKYYLEAYPDVRKADMDPLWHFVTIGWKEGRNPSPHFDTEFYLLNNPDVNEVGINPVLHYIFFGKDEGRIPAPKSPDAFSGEYDFAPPINNKLLETKIFNKPYNHQKQPEIDFNKDFRKVQHSHHFITKEFQTSNERADNLEQFELKISIIIPTKNAGDEFDFLLKMLNLQTGIKEIEIIIVDSGSKDNTVPIAKLNHAKVIEIAPEEFSHSYSRNLGAQSATGDFLFFTVQDALPPNKTWLHKLISEFKDKNVSAVSCAELPRENADLFYRIISWNHYKFLGVNENDRILSMPANPTHIELRKNGQLSDLACLIPAELFTKYKYRLSYAEDLDLGIRLIKDGHKIAFLGSTRIIHSHNRPGFYFLKRGYVDNVFLKDVFSDFKIPKVTFSDTAQDIIFLFNFIYSEICKDISDLDFPVEINNLNNIITQKLISASDYRYPENLDTNVVQYIDSELLGFINNLEKISDYPKIGEKYDGIMARALRNFIHMSFDYLCNIHNIIDHSLAEEIKSCIFKELSIISGSHLAYAYLNHSDEEKEVLKKINADLRQGV